MNELLNPKSMATPGAAGAVIMFVELLADIIALETRRDTIEQRSKETEKRRKS